MLPVLISCTDLQCKLSALLTLHQKIGAGALSDVGVSDGGQKTNSL